MHYTLTVLQYLPLNVISQQGFPILLLYRLQDRVHGSISIKSRVIADWETLHGSLLTHRLALFIEHESVFRGAMI